MTMQQKTPQDIFHEEKREKVSSYKGNKSLQDLSHKWMVEALSQRYVYHFEWLGRPVIQLPQDIVAFQEVIWDVKPDLIIETGIAHGGSLILSASTLAMLDYADAVNEGTVLDPQKPRRRVLGVDIDIREHNRIAIESHPLAGRIDMIQGSSVADDVIAQVREAAKDAKRVLVSLDSNHTHEHVLKELELYAPLVSKGSYCVVFDTIVDDMPEDFYPDRPWAPGDNPKTAVHAYLDKLAKEGENGADGAPLRFEIDAPREDKLLLTVAPDGFLKRI